MLSDQRLSEIRARLKAATPGPWVRASGIRREIRGSGGRGMHIFGVIDGQREVGADADADFIAASRTDIADLLAEVERLQAKEGAR